MARDRAFEELVLAHGTFVYSLLVRFVRRRETAEDLWQETFWAAARALERGERLEKPEAWLRTLAVRKAVDCIRRQEVRAELDGGTPEIEPAAPDAVGRAAEIEDELTALPPRERAAVLLAYQEGRPLSEVAALLEVPVGTVKTWLFRARAALKRRWKDGAP
ncbi:MAG TPA: sigma-70 family RNA polymerase sigma factor [Planctomycetota bacterium]|nr:sigma-70 family RNA polymerase sigma factor [Planctomycetota bacterium]